MGQTDSHACTEVPAPVSVLDHPPARADGPGLSPHQDPVAPTNGEPSSSPAVHAVVAPTAERGAWSLVWLGILGGGLGAWGAWTGAPAAAAVAPVLVAVGIAGLVSCWVSPSLRAVRASAVAGALASVALSQGLLIHGRRFYTTDAAAFVHLATRALLHGHDPFTTSMAGAAHLLDGAARYWTYTMNGGHVTRFSYPAGSFLVNAPAMGLGLTHQVVDWVDLAGWLVTGVLLLTLLPSSLRWLGTLVVLTPLFVGVFGSGGTDAAFLPFMVVAVWRWDRYGAPDGGAARWIGPVALGLACAIKQEPWFCVPFLAVGVGIEARSVGRSALRTATRYGAVVLAVFAAVNLPFVVWDAAAWWRGSLLPFLQPLVADGQGIVTMALHGLTGGVGVSYLELAGALAYVALLLTFGLSYPALKRAWPLLLPAAFFFSDRSLSNYLVDFFPVAVMAALSVRAVAASRVRPRRRALFVLPAVAGAGTVGALVLAFTSVPLQLAVRSVGTSASNGTITAVTVTVHNDTAGAVVPHFLVDFGANHPTGFWLPTGGSSLHLGAGATTTVTLTPPIRVYFPRRGTRWLVEAYTSSPRALSTSVLQQPWGT